MTRLSLDALLVLDAIDRRGSFAAAAEALFRVPSAITYSVQKLEQDLGVMLFDRSGHKAKLTSAGQLLLQEGRALLDSAAMLEQRVKTHATGWEGELRIAISELLPFARVIQLVREFNELGAQTQDLPAFRIDAQALSCRLELLGDGKRYKLNLRTDRGFDGVNYQAAFAPPAGQWATLRLALDGFQPSWRGRAVPDAPPLRGACIEQVGLMIADRQFGAFELSIGAIRAPRAGEGGEAAG